MLVIRTTVIGPFVENCYLVGCDRTKEAIVIDPGGDEARVLGMRHPGDFRVTRIFCTHGHIDHVAGATGMQAATAALLQIHEGDREWLAAIAEQAEMFGFGGVAAPTVQHLHVDGESFTVGEHQAQVLHTPGHSAGSCCLYFPADDVLFSGDTLFAGSVGRTDLPGGDWGELERSIREKLFPLGDGVRFYPGHGPGGLLGDERRNNPFVGEGRRGQFL